MNTQYHRGPWRVKYNCWSVNSVMCPIFIEKCFSFDILPRYICFHKSLKNNYFIINCTIVLYGFNYTTTNLTIQRHQVYTRRRLFSFCIYVLKDVKICLCMPMSINSCPFSKMYKHYFVGFPNVCLVAM